MDRDRARMSTLPRDVWLLFATRFVRLFAYGLLSVVLVLYLNALGLSEGRIGLLLTLTLLGDTALSLALATSADRAGRRKMLLVGALLMVCTGLVFAWAEHLWLLLLVATLGVLSPSGNEVGPFLAIEQAALAQLAPGGRRTDLFAWYNLLGNLATAVGCLCGGAITQLGDHASAEPAAVYRPLWVVYAVLGLGLALAFGGLSRGVEVASPVPQASRFGLHRSRGVVWRLSGLFALDAFGGGFVVQSLMAYWFHVRFGVNPAELGLLFFAANLLAGVSALAAAWLARRIGLVQTMVFTHLPSNVLLILVPLMPTLWLAVLLLLVRFSISQMDVPTRQALTMALVAPDERSAASGFTGVARSIGAALSPLLAGVLLGYPALLGTPFFLAGGIKIIYDLLLYRGFVGRQESGEG